MENIIEVLRTYDAPISNLAWYLDITPADLAKVWREILKEMKEGNMSAVPPTPDSILEYIQNYSDYATGVKNSQIYEDIKDTSTDFWNKSVEDAIMYFEENLKEYDMEDDTDETVQLIKRLKSADAGHSFTGNSSWVMPAANIDNKLYSQVRDEDMTLDALKKYASMEYTHTQPDTLPPADNVNDKWIRLLMPKNSHHVEVEDLNRNFWVIAQVIGSLSKYLFDPDSELKQMLKDVFDECTQLWENIAYLWMDLAAATQRRGGEPIVQVIPLTNNALQPYRKFDNFDNISTDTISAQDIITRIDYLKDKYSEQDVIVIPIIRLNNYQRNWYSAEYYPFIFWYFRGVGNWQYAALRVDNKLPLIDMREHKIFDYDYEQYLISMREEDVTYQIFSPYSDVEAYANGGKRMYGMLRMIPDLEVGFDGDGLLIKRLQLNFVDAAAQLCGRRADYDKTIFQIKLAEETSVQNNGRVDLIFNPLKEERPAFPAWKVFRDLNYDIIHNAAYMGELLSWYKVTGSLVPVQNVDFQTINIGHIVPETVFNYNAEWVSGGEVDKYGVYARTIKTSGAGGQCYGAIKFLPNDHTVPLSRNNLVSCDKIFNDNEYLKNLGVKIVQDYIAETQLDTSSLKIFLTHMGIEPWLSGGTCVWYKGYYGTIIGVLNGEVKHLGFVKRVEGFWNETLWRPRYVTSGNTKARQYIFNVANGEYDPVSGRLIVNSGTVTINDINRNSTPAKICDYSFTVAEDGSSLIFGGSFTTQPQDQNAGNVNLRYENISGPSLSGPQQAALDNVKPENTIPTMSGYRSGCRLFNRGVGAGNYQYA